MNYECKNTRITCQFRYGDLSDPILIKNNVYFNYNHCVPLTKNASHLKEKPTLLFKKILLKLVIIHNSFNSLLF